MASMQQQNQQQGRMLAANSFLILPVNIAYIVASMASSFLHASTCMTVVSRRRPDQHQHRVQSARPPRPSVRTTSTTTAHLVDATQNGNYRHIGYDDDDDEDDIDLSLTTLRTTESSVAVDIEQPITTHNSFVLAQPPPRRRQHQSMLFQLQRLTARRAVPAFNIKRSSPFSSASSSSPVAGSKRNNSKHKRQRDYQFSVYSCDDDRDQFLLSAAGFDLKLTRSASQVWHVRSDDDNNDDLAVYVCNESSPRDQLLGRWTRAQDGSKTWHFVSKRQVLAVLSGNRMDITNAAASTHHGQDTYVSGVRFDEALALTAVYVVAVEVFGRPPPPPPRLAEANSTRPRAPATATASTVKPGKKLTKQLSLPLQLDYFSSESRHWGASILRRSGTILRKTISYGSSRQKINPA
ncbi:hypothetical protein V1514DRAFT_334912 [Lipomyces japonicus]|uniref:uncharacterized protein n=1 Tax=Lipomyces japonicus TaxID=56871 RepID=UPI0034CE0108